MPRTTEAISFVACDVEVSQDGATWTDLSDYASSVGTSGGDRRTGEINVFGDERPIVRAGKKASQDLVIRFAYTEEAAGPFITIRGWDETEGGVIYVRYWPEGKVIGNYIFETGAAIITRFIDPGGEAEAGDPVLCELGVKCEQLSQSTYASP